MHFPVNTTYEPYSEDPHYIEANRGFIDDIDLDSRRRVADLACGTGLLSRLLLKRKQDLAICGIDMDPEQIAIATRSFGDRSTVDMSGWRSDGSGRVLLQVGSADELPFETGELDLVVMGNAIHLMPDKSRFLAEAARVLRRGGLFAFNSVFFVGTFAPGTEHLYTEWLKEAVLALEEMNQRRAAAGQPRIPRQRHTAGRAFTKGWMTPEQWQSELETAGFGVTKNSKRSVAITREGLKLVGAYGGLASVLMSGYPVEVASSCLQEGADRAFERMGIDQVPRLWLEMSAVRS